MVILSKTVVDIFFSEKIVQCELWIKKEVCYNTVWLWKDNDWYGLAVDSKLTFFIY